MVKKIANQRRIILMSPKKGDLSPKKATDQKAFKISWIKKRINPFLAWRLFSLFCQITNKDIPINRYRLTQTGPNIQLGGLKKGFFNDSYQVGIAGVVKIEPIKPAN
jgi:hypothetical protein